MMRDIQAAQLGKVGRRNWRRHDSETTFVRAGRQESVISDEPEIAFR
jgi:hypothetical protein